MRMTGVRAHTRPTPVPKMPTGLMELIEGMTKEVLRCNPTNVYEFCTTHMQKLLEIRDGPTGKRIYTLEQKISRAQDKIKQRAQARQRQYDNEMQLLYKTSVKDKEQSVPTSLVKSPVAHEMNWSSVEEIEISHCENNESVEISEDIITAMNETFKSKESNINPIMNESTIIGNGDDKTRPIEDKNIGDSVAELNYTCEHFDTDEFKDSSDNLEKPLVSEIFEEKTENIVMKDTANESISPVVTSLEENDKFERVVEIPTLVQKTKEDLEGSAFNKEEASIGEIHSDTVETKKEKVNNPPALIGVQLFDNEAFNNVLHKESSSTDNAFHMNVKVENENNVTIDSITDTPTKMDDNDLKISVNNADNEEISLVALEINSDSIHNDVTLETICEDIDNPITNMKGRLDNKAIEENELDTENDNSSHLSRHIPPKIGHLLEDSKGSASNDNRGPTNNMDLETAAITIQKVFRTFLFKSRVSNDETSSIEEDVKEANGFSSQSPSNDRRPLGITRMDTMLQTVNEEKSLSLSTDDSSTLSSAATIIQAHIRGFLVRNKLNSNKTASTNSILNSDDPVTPLTENEINENHNNNKTVLNIHIVPDSNVPSLSRDESIITSMDLSLDGSPSSSINLHPLGYDKSERRKQLKREDAIQSISPPSNNSGKHSEDVDSTKEILINCVTSDGCSNDNTTSNNNHAEKNIIMPDVPLVQDTLNESLENHSEDNANSKTDITSKNSSLTKMSSDEMDVVTPYLPDDNQRSEPSNTQKLMHSGELHDVVLPTNVSRGSTSVVRGE